jgi:ribosomal protein L19
MSNLLDKASIILTPTASNNGEALCVKPSDGSGDFDFSRNSAATRVNAQGLVENVQILSSNLVQNGDFSEEGVQEVSNGSFSQEGAELVTNGSFTNGSTDWALGSQFSIGTNKAIYDNSGSGTLVQSFNWQVGKTYKITFDIGDFTTSQRFDVYSGISFIKSSTVESNTSYTIYFNGDGGSTLRFRGLTTESFSITNISVKEVGQNWNFTNVGGSNGWRIANDRAICDAEGINNGRNINSSTTLVNGKTYKLTLDILQSVDGMNVLIGSTTLPNELPTGTNLGYEYYIDASQHSGGLFSIYGGTSDLQEIDNITIIEITDDTNLPRINYEGFSYDGSGNVVPDSGCGSWLFEPQSTNLITQSELFSDASWVKTNTTISSNSVTSPNGTIDADYLQENSSNATHIIRQDFSLSATSYTLSIFAKQGAGSERQIGLLFNSNSSGALFNLTDGSVISTIGTPITKAQEMGNGWYRFSITTTSTAITENCRIYLGNNGIWTSAYQGDGTSGVYIWGAMLEQNSLSTSYIPTEGSTVTRNQDVCTNGGSLASINSTEGVLYAEIAALSNDGTYRILSLSNGTSVERIYMQYTNASNTISVVVKKGSVTQANISFALSDETEFSKIGFKYKENDFALWVNGVKVGTDTSGNTPIGLSELAFDSGTGGNNFFGKTKAVAVWKEALSDAELTELTTI